MATGAVDLKEWWKKTILGDEERARVILEGETPN